MTEYENFLLSMYYAKLKLMAVKSGDLAIPWDDSAQRSIDALAGFAGFEIEAHFIATKEYFKQLTYTEIIELLRMCCIQQGEERNVNTFTMCVYNRADLLIKQNNRKEPNAD